MAHMKTIAIVLRVVSSVSIPVEIEGQIIIWCINDNFSATPSTGPALLPALSEQTMFIWGGCFEQILPGPYVKHNAYHYHHVCPCHCKVTRQHVTEWAWAFESAGLVYAPGSYIWRPCQDWKALHSECMSTREASNRFPKRPMLIFTNYGNSWRACVNCWVGKS